MEHKIGEIFNIDNEWYQCIQPEESGKIDCNTCDFQCSKNCKFSRYSSGYRSDKTSVIFKKLEKVGEPITVNGKNVQLLKTTIANCDNCAFYKDVNCDFTCYPRRCYGGEEGTYVEIKTKEDMEEKKLNLKPFDIQKAREGKPVCTRDGRKARIICFDKGGEQPIVALIEKNEEESIDIFFSNGHSISKTNKVPGDLMMLPEKKEGWVKIRKDINLYDTKEEADRKMIGNDEYITAKVCWEE